MCRCSGAKENSSKPVVNDRRIFQNQSSHLWFIDVAHEQRTIEVFRDKLEVFAHTKKRQCRQGWGGNSARLFESDVLVNLSRAKHTSPRERWYTESKYQSILHFNRTLSSTCWMCTCVCIWQPSGKLRLFLSVALPFHTFKPVFPTSCTHTQAVLNVLMLVSLSN